MAEPIIMPKLGFDMAEGTLINWTVEIGQAIKKGDVIAEIETDKATIEIETTVEGTVLQLLATADGLRRCCYRLPLLACPAAAAVAVRIYCTVVHDILYTFMPSYHHHCYSCV